MIEYYAEDFNKCLNDICQINLYQHGKKKEIKLNRTQKAVVKNYFSNILKDAHVLPALGVSLHDETKKEMQSGEWVEILFSSEQAFEGMNFEGLVFKLEETNGLNIIRILNGKYEGRNFYVMLNKEIDLFDVFHKFKS